MVNAAAWSWLKGRWRRNEHKKPSPGDGVQSTVKVDGYDVCIFVGFVSLMAGIALYSVPLALIIGGCLLLVVGLAGSARRHVR